MKKLHFRDAQTFASDCTAAVWRAKIQGQALLTSKMVDAFSTSKIKEFMVGGHS